MLEFIKQSWGYIAGILFALAVAGIIAICVKVDESHSEPVATKKKKQYAHELAENVRYFDYEFIDRELFTFKNCRVKKLRKGAFTFGAFNVIEFDDLIINIPAESTARKDYVRSDGENQESNTFSRVFSSFKTMGKRKFSGIEVNNLVINKYLTADCYVQIKAQRAESSFKKTINLKQCLISTNAQRRVRVSNAYIEFQPVPVVRYTNKGRKGAVEL